MKIHIIGGSGSGKSYLSRNLAKEYGIQNFELDDIFWDNSEGGYGTKRSIEDRNKKLLDVLSMDDWIIEGVYHKWLYQSFSDADVIVIMLPSVWLQHFRAISRFIKRKVGLGYTNKKETLSGLIALLKWNHKYNTEKLDMIFDFLSEFEAKTIMVKNGSEAMNRIKLVQFKIKA